MRILFSPLPAAQLHPPVQGTPASAGLRAKQVIIWEDVMSRSESQLSRDEAVKVPVNCHAVDVFSGFEIFQDLRGPDFI